MLHRTRSAATVGMGLGLVAAVLVGTPAFADGPRPRPVPGDGQLCGSPEIVGERLARIDGPGGCDVARPVRVRAVAGVALEPPPILACDTARALAAWVHGAARPEAARLGERLAGLAVADHYACRNRNRAAAGKLSEHARGGAIDIAGFRMAGGVTATVAADWHDPRLGPMLRRIHAAGCGPFRTTLGPGSDGFHEDHLHYDVARRRNGGTWCR